MSVQAMLVNVFSSNMSLEARQPLLGPGSERFSPEMAGLGSLSMLHGMYIAWQHILIPNQDNLANALQVNQIRDNQHGDDAGRSAAPRTQWAQAPEALLTPSRPWHCANQQAGPCARTLYVQGQSHPSNSPDSCSANPAQVDNDPPQSCPQYPQSSNQPQPTPPPASRSCLRLGQPQAGAAMPERVNRHCHPLC